MEETTHYLERERSLQGGYRGEPGREDSREKLMCIQIVTVPRLWG